MRIEHLYRYPVKGLTAEALEQTDVLAGGTIPWDRAFALAQGDSGFDPAMPVWLAKYNFMCLMKNERIATLRSHFDTRSGLLAIIAPNGSGVTENALSTAGRERIAAYLTGFMGDEARGSPSFQYLPGHVFGDQKTPVISLINLESLRDYEAKIGERRHRRRFRANIWFNGTPAWSEFAWVGRTIQVGGALLRVNKRIVRCAATQVNPETAIRDADPVQELHRTYGHSDLGIHAEVIEGGKFALGDSIEVLPD